MAPDNGIDLPWCATHQTQHEYDTGCWPTNEWGCWRHATFSIDFMPWQCAKCGRTMRPYEDIRLHLWIRRRLRGMIERIKGWKAKAHQALSDLTNKEN